MRTDYRNHAARACGFSFLAVVLLVGMLVAPVAAAGTPDQSQENISGEAMGVHGEEDNTEVPPPQLVAQTFTAGITGELDHVDVYVRWDGPEPTADLVVEIRAVDMDGLPTGGALTAETVLVGSMSGDGWVSVPLTPGVNVTDGTQYAIVLRSSSDFPGYGWVVNDATTDEYMGGSTWTASDDTTWAEVTDVPGHEGDVWDTAFRTYVTAPSNEPPTVSAGGDVEGDEGSPLALDGTVVDDGSPTTSWGYSTLGADPGATCSFDDHTSVDTTITCTDDGTYTVTLTADDGDNDPVTDSATVTVANVAPSVTASGGGAHEVNTPVTVSAAYTEAGTNDTHDCSIAWGDGATSEPAAAEGACTDDHTYTDTGPFTVTVTVIDDDGGVGVDTLDVLVVDEPTADSNGEVTGGGTVHGDIPVSFGFNATDEGGMSGQLQVRTHGADRQRFHGHTVESFHLSGNTATWSGAGQLNGEDGFTFEVTVEDNGNGGSRRAVADTFSITVSDGSTTVLAASGELSGGNIQIHTD